MRNKKEKSRLVSITRLLEAAGVKNDTTLNIDSYAVDQHFIETMGLRLSSGTDFLPGFGDSRQAILNRASVNRLKLDEVIGASLQIEGQNYSIAGVVDDYVFNGAYWTTYLDSIFPLSKGWPMYSPEWDSLPFFSLVWDSWD